MTRISRTLATCLLTVVVGVQLPAAHAAPPAQIQPLSAAELDAVVQKSMRTFHVPGIAVAVVKDDRLIYAKGFGVRSLATGQKVDDHTLFGIASNSKAFTAAALSMLVEQKKLNWDDKVTDYIPEFKMANPYVTAEFTIRDLLTHRSGLGLGAGDLMLWPEGSDFTKEEVIHNIRYLQAVSGFRSKFDYDNNLYIVAGEVVARVSGMSWEDFIEQRLFRPLGMNESFAARRRVHGTDNIVDPHVEFDGKVQPVDATVGDVANAAGGIVSNLDDLAKWLRMLMKGGKLPDGSALLNGEQLEQMWSPQTILPVSANNNIYNTHFSAYGLGWFLSDVHGFKQVTHTGGLTGIVTQVTIIPELHLGIVVLTNQQVGTAFRAITDTIKDGYFGMPRVDRVDQYNKLLQQHADEADTGTQAVWDTVEKNRATPGVVPFDPSMLVGTYRDQWLGEVTLSVKDGALRFVSRRSPKLTGTLYFYKGATYAVKWDERSMLADAYATFSFGVDGKASGIRMDKISPLTDFSFDFQDLDLQRETAPVGAAQ